MKKIIVCSFLVIICMLIGSFSGCIVIQPVSSEAPKKSELPRGSVQPTESPSDTLLLPDNDVQASFLFDLNGDGANETISVGLGAESGFGNDIILSVSDSGAFNQITIDSGYFESAFLTALQGGAPCLLVSCSHEDDFSLTFACSFNGLYPILKGSVEGHITDVSDFYITVENWVDALGTWRCSRIYGVTDEFAFEPLNDFQIDMGERDPLITKIKLPVKIWKDDNYTTAVLDAGTAVYPTATDGSTYLLFTLDDGREGMISFTIQDHEYFIGDVIQDDCFEELPYAG